MLDLRPLILACVAPVAKVCDGTLFKMWTPKQMVQRLHR